MSNGEPTTLLTTELELVAPFDLSPLLAHLGSRASPLRNSVDGAVHTLWLEPDPEPRDLDAAIDHWVTIVDALPAHLRSLWDACTDRCLNTGIQSGFSPHASRLAVSEGSVKGAARIAVRLVFTVYAADHSHDERAPR